MQFNIENIEEDGIIQEDENIEQDNDFTLSKLYENIPENNISIKVHKKVSFNEKLKETPLHNSIPKQYSKIVRQQVYQDKEKSKISYQDILSKMGMFVSDGKLHLSDKNTVTEIKQYQQ